MKKDKMWHEARKQERRIRGMIVDYRRRAERRQDFYERIQADPTQFIQVHGRRCRIHLDPAVAAAGDGAAIIVPWQGHQDNLIDRFDVRAHLDHIPPVPKQSDSDAVELTTEERQCNYERYRILAQNDFLGVVEEKFLHQLYLEEQFGANAQLEAEQRSLGKKKQKLSGATIGYSYGDTESAVGPQPFSHLMNVSSAPAAVIASKSEKDSESDSESDIDMDVSIEVTKLDTSQAHELNACGRNYGMLSNDFYSFLTKDADEAEALRMAREEEQEKILLSGRKSRRERRAQKERRIACRPFSPPSYAAKEDEAAEKNKNVDDSDSRSPSPADPNTGKITYITSFGGEDELQPHSKISININNRLPSQTSQGVGCPARTAPEQKTYAEKVKENLDKLKILNETSKLTASRRSSRGTSRQRKSYTRSRSRSRSRLRSRLRSRSRDRRAHRDVKRYRRSHSSSREKLYKQRSRRLRSDSRSRSRSHSRPRSSRRQRRYSSTSTRSSTSSTSSDSSSRSAGSAKQKRTRTLKQAASSSERSHNHSRAYSPKPKANPKPFIKQSPAKVVNTAVSSASMVSYPLPLRAIGVDLNAPPPPPPPPVTAATPSVEVAPPPPLKRYYGRKRGSSSSDSSASDSDAESNDIKTESADVKGDTVDRTDVEIPSEPSNPLPSISAAASSGISKTGKYTSTANNPSFSNASETKGANSSSGAGTSSQNRLNLRERLKRKMQNLLNKQYKADKRAEIEKTERERQLQQERDDEMRELALKLRRRQREIRHKYGTPNSSKSSESDASDNTVAPETRKNRRSRSHSSESSAPPMSRSDDVRTGADQAAENEPSQGVVHTKQRRSSSRDYESERQGLRSLSRNRGRQHSPSDQHSSSRQHSPRSNHSRSHGRNHSRSRSRSYYRTTRRSRSRSRGRRSASRRPCRSPSRTRRTRERSYDRSGSRYAAVAKTRYDERNRRSRSRSDRSSYRDRTDRKKECNKGQYPNKEHERKRDWERDSVRDRDQQFVGSNNATPAPGSSRNRIVISAPPKLKKLVDY